MANSLNITILIGRIGKEPEYKYVESGAFGVLKFTLATSESHKDKITNEWKEHTEWHNIQITGQAADNYKERLHKGNIIGIMGTSKTREWKTTEGISKRTTEIRPDKIILFGKPEPIKPAIDPETVPDF